MQKKVKLSPTGTYQIYFTPEDKFERLVRDVSKKIKKEYKPKFVFDGIDHIPHMTIYLFSAPVRNERLIIKELEKMTRDLKSVTLTTKGLLLTHDGWLMIEFKNVGKVDDIHKIAVGRINALREGILRKKYRNNNFFDDMSDNEKYVLEKYGDRHSMKLYNPHVSLAEFESYKDGLAAEQKYRRMFEDVPVRLNAIEMIRNYVSLGGEMKVLFKKNLN